MEWNDIKTAPHDKPFLALIGGIPYKAKYDEHGRFIWYMHTDCGEGAEYCVHKENGLTLLEKTREAKPRYEPRGILWCDGLNDNPTHWTEYTEPKS